MRATSALGPPSSQTAARTTSSANARANALLSLPGARLPLIPARDRSDMKFEGKFVGCDGSVSDSLSAIKPVQLSSGESSAPTIIYVNGIMTTKDAQVRTMKKIADQTGQPVIGIHSATSGALGEDLGNCCSDKGQFRKNAASDQMSDVIHEKIIKGEPVHIMAHSRGGLSTSWAISQVKQRMRQEGMSESQIKAKLRSLRVETFRGGAARYPDGPVYTHYVNKADPVPTQFGIDGNHEAPLGTKKGEGATVHRFNKPHLNPLDNHSMTTYLNERSRMEPRPSSVVDTFENDPRRQLGARITAATSTPLPTSSSSLHMGDSHPVYGTFVGSACVPKDGQRTEVSIWQRYGRPPPGSTLRKAEIITLRDSAGTKLGSLVCDEKNLGGLDPRELAYSGDQVEGDLAVRLYVDTLDNLTDPNENWKGIGTVLMNEAVFAAYLLGLDGVELTASARGSGSAHPARQSGESPVPFYLKYGFEPKKNETLYKKVMAHRESGVPLAPDTSGNMYLPQERFKETAEALSIQRGVPLRKTPEEELEITKQWFREHAHQFSDEARAESARELGVDWPTPF